MPDTPTANYGMFQTVQDILSRIPQRFADQGGWGGLGNAAYGDASDIASAVAHPFMSVGQVMDNGFDPYNQADRMGAFNVAANLAGGGFTAGRLGAVPAGSIGMGAGGRQTVRDIAEQARALRMSLPDMPTPPAPVPPSEYGLLIQHLLGDQYPAAAEHAPAHVAYDFGDSPGGNAPWQYHGTSSPIPRLYNDGYNNRNIYGPAFYTTDAVDIMRGYTGKGKSTARSRGAYDPTGYQVTENSPARLKSMESEFTPSEYEYYANHPHEAVAESAAMGGDSGVPPRNLRELHDAIRQNSRDMGLTRDDVQDVFETLRHPFEQQGYQGYSHIGGHVFGNEPHNVNIYWNPEQDVSIRPLLDPRVAPLPDWGPVLGHKEGGPVDIRAGIRRIFG